MLKYVTLSSLNSALLNYLLSLHKAKVKNYKENWTVDSALFHRLDVKAVRSLMCKFAFNVRPILHCL